MTLCDLKKDEITLNDLKMIVYFIQAGENGPVKIGITKNISSRMRWLQTGNHAKLTLLYSYEVHGDIKKEEKMLHEWFKYQHIQGEWFRPDKYLIDTIDKFKKGERTGDEWSNWEGDICELDQDYREVAKKYRQIGNYNAVQYIASQLYELYEDIFNGRF